MAKINKYGLKIKGLKKASGSTKNYGIRSGNYDEIFYDRSTGEVWTVFQSSYGHNSWTVYHDSDIIKICETEQHLTMQDIADKIYNNLLEIENEYN